MANIETGIYRIKEERLFRFGVSVFTMDEGSEVEIRQVDKANGNVLIEFCSRHCDWFPISEMKYLEKINTNL